MRLDVRQDMLLQVFRFSCDCFMCLDSQYRHQRGVVPIIVLALGNSRGISDFSVGKSRKAILRQIKNNFAILNCYCGEQTTMTCAQLMADTLTMLCCLSNYLSYPCLKSKLLEHPFRHF